MKILRRPRQDSVKPWKTRARCNGDKIVGVAGCKASLEIYERDLKPFHYFGSHFQHRYLSVKCPLCGAIIQKLNVPDYVFRKWGKNHPRDMGEFDGFDDRI